MPLLMEVEDAVALMIDGIYSGKRRIAFPRRLYYVIRLLGMMPRFLQKEAPDDIKKPAQRAGPLLVSLG